MNERYLRNLSALSEGECRLLRSKRILVVGCGGLGGYIIEMLTRIGVGAIRAVDGDRFDYELSVLWQAALHGVRMKLISIQTIYFNNNSGTHFRKVKDTVLLYLTLAKCNRAAVACRIAVFLSLLLISVFAGGIPWFLAMPVSWLGGKLVCLALRKMGRFKGLPLKGALREAGHSLFGLCLTLAVSAGFGALWPECPIVLSWVAGRAIALPLRYFFCKMLSQSAFSAERSSLSSAPK